MECSGRDRTAGHYLGGQKEKQTRMLRKPKTLATTNRGRELNTLLTVGNNVRSLFAACRTSRIVLPFTLNARFRPSHYSVPEITLVMYDT